VEKVGTLPDLSRARGREAEPRALQARLESALPPRLAVGAANALFVHGWCFCADSPIRELRVGAAGEEVRALAHGMPRPDVFRAFHPGLDPRGGETLIRDEDSAVLPPQRLLGDRPACGGPRAHAR